MTGKEEWNPLKRKSKKSKIHATTWKIIKNKTFLCISLSMSLGPAVVAQQTPIASAIRAFKIEGANFM